VVSSLPSITDFPELIREVLQVRANIELSILHSTKIGGSDITAHVNWTDLGSALKQMDYASPVSPINIISSSITGIIPNL